MTACEKCGAAVAPDAAECPRCGVVFAKLRARQEAEAASLPPIARPVATSRDPAGDILAGPARFARITGLVVLTWWTWWFARLGVNEAVGGSVLHMPNLVFHEAGHVLFGFFGRFMTVLGGSLFQVVFPLVFAIAFLRQKNPFAAAVCTWWAGQNLVDVAPYIADARALQLVLLGGRTGAEVEGHDWEYILTTLGWTHLDVTIGLWTQRIGLAVMIASIAWGAISVRVRPAPSSLE
jgi:ribosomal protein L40E